MPCAYKKAYTRMKRGAQQEILIEDFQPSAYLLAALAGN